MGKRKETSEEDTRESASSSSPKKKHKHKHKKHKKKDKREHGEHDDHSHRRERKEKEKEEKKGGLKLKIKLGGQTVTTTEVTKIVSVEDDLISSAEEEDAYQPSWPVSEIEEVEEDIDDEEVDIEADVPGELELDVVDDSSKSPPEANETHDDLEEQQWLDALEAGELDDYGRIKQEKDISTMTARQRAMLGHEIEGENQLLELPTETRRKDEDSEEAQKRRKQRAKKRKQQMEKQIEENKAQTVQKLLTKQATRSKKDKEMKKKDKLAGIPRITYISNVEGIRLSFPSGVDLPLQSQTLSSHMPKSRPKCAVKSCNNYKKYSCSKTNLPICSLECYNKVQYSYKGPKILAAAV